MKVKVRSMGLVSLVLGAAELEVDVPDGSRVVDLLRHLAELKGEKFAPFAAHPKKPSPYSPVRVVLNGRDVGPAEHQECELSEGDDVLLFLPIAGG